MRKQIAKRTERDLLLVLQDALENICVDAGRDDFIAALNLCRSSISDVEQSLSDIGD